MGVSCKKTVQKEPFIVGMVVLESAIQLSTALKRCIVCLPISDGKVRPIRVMKSPGYFCTYGYGRYTAYVRGDIAR